MSRFFIDRPIFAWVIAIVIMLAGILSITTLSISQYPQIAPTTVRVSANYSGADAQTVENSVTKVIEQGMTGIDNLDYMTSTSTATGQASISLTFTNKANPDVAQMQVQNKLQLVTAQLPQSVQNTGIVVSKSTSNFLMVIGFVSTDGRMNSNDLADYISSTLNDTLKRVPGVGDTQLFGAGYAMRIWVDPDKLAKYQLMVSDVTNAIEAQNTQVAAGQLGALPQRGGQQLNATVTAKSRLQTPEQFENIILKSLPNGSLVRLNDVATVELGASAYTSSGTFNGKPSAGLAIMLASGANAIDTAEAVQSTINNLSQTLPANVEVVYPYDTTPFVKLSIEDVVKTLFEAIVLVFIVMFVFLQNIRATLIPTLAVPVVLLGTFAVLVGLRLFDQYLDDVRHGAGDRPSGRRRHCRGGKRRTRHGRGRPLATRGDHQVDERDHRRADRHRHRALRRLHSDGLLLAARSASSIGNSPSPSFRRWCSRSWWRWC